MSWSTLNDHKATEEKQKDVIIWRKQLGMGHGNEKWKKLTEEDVEWHRKRAEKTT